MESIKIINAYLDTLARNQDVLQTIVKKSFTAKTSYYLARILDKLQKETEIYLAEKQKIIEKHAKRHEDDGTTWKKGDMVINGESVSLSNINAFTKDFNELINIEIDIKIDKIEFDLEKEPACTVEEMSVLLPIISIN